MRRATAWMLMAAFTLIGVGCATVPPCPARGGPAWTQWESDHFVVLTDLGAEDALEVVRGFEDMRQAVLLAAWRRAPEPRGRLGVVVFRDDSELRAFLPSRMIGAFITVGGGPMRQSFIVKGGAGRDDVVTHELVHALALSYGLLNKVEWIDEDWPATWKACAWARMERWRTARSTPSSSGPSRWGN